MTDQPSRLLNREHLIAAQKAWGREQAKKNLPDSSNAWDEWIGRPSSYLLPVHEHIIAAQKAWAAEQTKKHLPRTHAAWEAWVAGPAQKTSKETTDPSQTFPANRLNHRDQSSHSSTPAAVPGPRACRPPDQASGPSGHRPLSLEHLMAAQKAWGAEQAKKNLPRTNVAWEA